MNTEYVRDERVVLPSTTSGQLDYYPVEPNTLGLRIGEHCMADNGVGVIMWLGKPFGSVDYLTGALRFDLPVLSSDGPVLASYEYRPFGYQNGSRKREKTMKTQGPMSGCIVLARTDDGGLSAVQVETRQQADELAKEQAEQLGIEVAVFEHVGTWKPKTLPVEFVPAANATKRRTDNDEADHPVRRVERRETRSPGSAINAEI